MPVLVGVTQRDVPAIGALVEGWRHRHRVDLDDHLHPRPDGEVASSSHHAPESRVKGVAADLVRVCGSRLAIYPPQDRFRRRLVLRVRQEVNEQGHASPGFPRVTIHTVAHDLLTATNRHDRVAYMGRCHVLPLEIFRVATDGQVEPRRDCIPQRREAFVKMPNRLGAAEYARRSGRTVWPRRKRDD